MPIVLANSMRISQLRVIGMSLTFAALGIASISILITYALNWLN